jgi:hypothetical protein
MNKPLNSIFPAPNFIEYDQMRGQHARNESLINKIQSASASIQTGNLRIASSPRTIDVKRNLRLNRSGVNC